VLGPSALFGEPHLFSPTSFLQLVDGSAKPTMRNWPTFRAFPALRFVRVLLEPPTTPASRIEREIEVVQRPVGIAEAGLFAAAFE